MMWRGWKTAYRIALLILLMFTGCAAPPQEAPPPVNSAPPTLRDDFDPPYTAWVRFDTEGGAVYALQGELYLEDRGQGIAVYTPLMKEQYRDVTVSVQMRHVQGAINNWMGVMCRQQDEENYYLFAISADGYYLILRVEDGEPTPLTGPQASDVILTGRAANTLEARCRGTSLSLRVNDTLLVTRVDDALSAEGYVGLFADAVGRGQTTTVAFDNFTLTVP